MEKESREFWIDEKGKHVGIYSFLSKVFVDEEIKELSRKYNTWFECGGRSRSNTLGRSERESLAAQILVLIRATNLNPPTLVGVSQIELEEVLKNSCELHHHLPFFIQNGFLRVKWIKGCKVLFPTEKLLEKMEIKKRIR